ncbi:SLAM family member 5-like isoform X2 [Brienomyrus brachyistius]|uniref:SLAM family member 5-like isoform X2 n=1 Tax=Brienomyrus brachyistius TaxID=42636 RepID=UPI0020B29A2F|nr:SLAM family member 5-like isoform X2 [Brienomyrus brachyistius]
MFLSFICLLLPFAVLNQAYSGQIPLFVLSGASVRLSPKGHEAVEMESIVWILNSSIRLMKYDFEKEELKLHNKYKNRLEFDSKTSSMVLNNLTGRDNGLYIAKVTDVNGYEHVSQFLLSVQERAGPPLLRVDSNSSSPDSCNVTLTCMVHNTSISTTCDSHNCSQVEGASPALSISVMKDFILCNHSNQVSWANATVRMSELCPLYIDHMRQTQKSTQNLLITLILIAITTVVFTVTFLLSRWACGRHTEQIYSNTEDTHEPTVATVQSMYDVIRTTSLQKAPQSDTIYASVQKFQHKSQRPPDQPEATESTNTKNNKVTTL